MYVGWQNVSAEALKGCYNPSPSLKDDILNDMKSTSSANDIPRPPLSPFDRFAILPLGSPLGTDTIFVDIPESRISFKFHIQLCLLLFKIILIPYFLNLFPRKLTFSPFYVLTYFGNYSREESIKGRILRYSNT
jgi:hypothetical protein